jgi:hypothetical protein
MYVNTKVISVDCSRNWRGEGGEEEQESSGPGGFKYDTFDIL